MGIPKSTPPTPTTDSRGVRGEGEGAEAVGVGGAPSGHEILMTFEDGSYEMWVSAVGINHSAVSGSHSRWWCWWCWLKVVAVVVHSWTTD